MNRKLKRKFNCAARACVRYRKGIATCGLTTSTLVAAVFGDWRSVTIAASLLSSLIVVWVEPWRK